MMGVEEIMGNMNKALDKIFKLEMQIENLDKEKSIITLEYT